MTQSASGCPFRPAPVRDGFQPYYSAELHAAMAAARAEAPVFWCEEIGYWVLTRYEDVLSVLQDGERFSAQNTTRPVTPMHSDALRILQDAGFASTGSHASRDGAVHRRIRQTTSQVLNLREFMQLEPGVRALVRAALERLERRQQVDLHAELSYELPAQVIFMVLGIPDSDIQTIKKWAGARSVIDFSPSSYEQQIEGAHNLAAYWQYCTDMVHDRLQSPRDDFTSRILALRNGDDAVMTIPEVITHTFDVAFAGHETTTNQLSNTFRTLLAHRSEWDALCAEPALAANTVEEGLRHAGAVIGWRRIALQDVRFQGIDIPKGAPIMLSFASANRDEAVFPDPHRFDIRRKNARRHLTMGNGVHFCLGAPLSRLEMKIVFEEFPRVFPNARLVEPDPAEHLKTFVFRAPHALPVALRGGTH